MVTQAANLSVVRSYKRRLGKTIRIKQLIFFGSRARGTFNEASDFDVLIISPDFRGVPWHRRGVDAYLAWHADLPLELLCFTPEEVEERRHRTSIVAEALATGIVV